MSCSILTILSHQGKCKICKYSQSPFNQFSFNSQSYLFSCASKLDWTISERMWIRREFWILILNSFFAECCRACQLSLYRSRQQCSDSQVHCSSPLQRMKRDRLMLGNRYTLISFLFLSFLNWKLQSKPLLCYGDLNLNQCQTDLSFLNMKLQSKPFLWHGDLNQSFFMH